MVNKKVLIVYDTRYGATEITSKDISNVLEEKGVDVDLINLKPLNIEQWPDPVQYDGIIVGSSVAMFRWKKKPKKFLKKNKKKFVNKILAVFVSCGTCVTDPEKAREKYLDKIMDGIGITPNITEAIEPVLDISENSGLKPMTRKLIRGMAQDFANDAGISLNEEGINDFRDKEKLSRFINSFQGKLKNIGFNKNEKRI